MMAKLFKDDSVVFDPKNKYEAANMNPFEMTQISSEIFETFNRSLATGCDLKNLILHSNIGGFVFSFEDSQTFFELI